MDEKEFLAALKYIYGDAQMDGKLMKLMQHLRKTNPELLRSYAKQKRNEAYNPPGGAAPAYQTPRFSVAAPTKADKIERRGPSPKEVMESRFDAGDFSGLSDFGTAFNEAKKRGREEFNWRSTKANPSGRFNTLLRPAKQAAPVQEMIPEEEIIEEYFDNTNFPIVPINPSAKVSDSLKYNFEESLRGDAAKAYDEMFAKSQEELRQQEILEHQKRRLAMIDFGAAHGYIPEGYKKLPVKNLLELVNDVVGKAFIPVPLGNPGQSVLGEPNKGVPFRQQGGTMGANDQELQKAFMAFLIEDAAAQGMQIQSEQDLQAYAQQLGEEGLKAKYQEFMQKMQGGVKAALGAKLNYINKLKGNCPSGTESYYFREGGSIKRGCKPCMEKAKEGKKVNKMNEIEKFKAAKGCKTKKK